MLSNIQKSIIIRALQIRQKQGEDPEEAVLDYKRLTLEERQEIIFQMKGEIENDKALY